MEKVSNKRGGREICPSRLRDQISFLNLLFWRDARFKVGWKSKKTNRSSSWSTLNIILFVSDIINESKMCERCLREADERTTPVFPSCSVLLSLTFPPSDERPPEELCGRTELKRNSLSLKIIWETRLTQFNLPEEENLCKCGRDDGCLPNV